MRAFIVKSEKELVTLSGNLRKKGKVEAKKCRELNLVPCCLYGKGIPNVQFSISSKEAIKLRKGQILYIKIDGTTYKSVIKEIQYDYLKDRVLHVDFMGLVENRAIEVEVPVEIVGESIGVKKGGILQILTNSLSIKVLPENIPEKIVVDISNLDIGDSIHVSDLSKQDDFKNIKFVNRMDTTIVTVTAEEQKESSEQQS
ncbi:MAG: 50S ribosomal protein L25 [bacterium]